VVSSGYPAFTFSVGLAGIFQVATHYDLSGHYVALEIFMEVIRAAKVQVSLLIGCTYCLRWQSHFGVSGNVCGSKIDVVRSL